MQSIYRPFDHVWDGEPFRCPWCGTPLSKGDSTASQSSANGHYVFSVCEPCDRKARYGE
jgi:RNase P subunit RPR2